MATDRYNAAEARWQKIWDEGNVLVAKISFES
jgi:hypothetical protein